ncbi:hypothetical protein MNR01_13090 [Lysobacter sp. S4-A87]|uniref:hypothetical protein n=1 Tax=Lysobacter sp. S4-A87 TaxID=2925843 RepID=UPI001F536BBE|nr:hypothetical protein [Lysobacter sp. S4-A87]UNK48672.1 hypothetical protein MNR01_13090 [Lysobacter sp. S4-A87]
MRFEKLIQKVEQAEDALEVSERAVAADVARLRTSWREAWTPGRIVIAGLAAGFVVGRAEPLRTLGKGGGLMQLVTMVSGLFAGGSAQVAAEGAEQAAASAEQAVATPASAVAATTGEDDEAATLARAEATVQAARVAVVDPVEP